jgi:hypothetical protein
MGFVVGALGKRALVGLTSVLLGGASLMALGAAGSAPAGATVRSHAIVLTTAPTSLTFQPTTLGDARALPFLVTNTSGSAVNIPTYTVTGADPNDFAAAVSTDCVTLADGSVELGASDSCHLFAIFLPGALGARSASITLTDSGGSALSPPVSVSGTGSIGYYIASATGAVRNFGDAQSFGDASNLPLNHPIVGIAQTGDNGGYWLVASDGGIFTYGNAQFYGSTGNIALNKPIVGMAPTVDAAGYWLVASDGGIFSYGDAQFYGSTGNIHLNEPIVGMAAAPDGKGYWFVASDGGVFNYGSAGFAGSLGGSGVNDAAGISTGI